MNKKIGFVLGAVILIGLITWIVMERKGVGQEAETATSTVSNSTSSEVTVPGSKGGKAATGTAFSGTSQKKTYANSEYGFKIQYPNYLNQTYGYSPFKNILPLTWRVNPSAANQGKAILTIPVYQVDQGDIATGKSYPLFFDTETRIGVSDNTKDCYETDSGYTNQKVTNVTINGVTWKRFDFQDAGMMKYFQGESYRTIHANKCYAIEVIKIGSSYRDDTMKIGTSDTTLDGYYAVARSIAYSFVFTK